MFFSYGRVSSMTFFPSYWFTGDLLHLFGSSTVALLVVINPVDGVILRA